MIIFEGEIPIIAQPFDMIVVSEYKYAALTLSSTDLVKDGITEMMIGYALSLGMR